MTSCDLLPKATLGHPPDLPRGLPQGAVAVIFLSRRTANDDAGYAEAAAAMEARAAAHDGYLGIHSTRGTDGFGITVSWWRDEKAAEDWRDDAEHARIRALGRALWYQWYRVIVSKVDRVYEWTAAAERPSHGADA
ncbi:antibiotic biosynthesis monooxygenase family protein [Acidisoma sp. C75]